MASSRSVNASADYEFIKLFVIIKCKTNCERRINAEHGANANANTSKPMRKTRRRNYTILCELGQSLFLKFFVRFVLLLYCPVATELSVTFRVTLSADLCVCVCAFVMCVGIKNKFAINSFISLLLLHKRKKIMEKIVCSPHRDHFSIAVSLSFTDRQYFHVTLSLLLAATAAAACLRPNHSYEWWKKKC